MSSCSRSRYQLSGSNRTSAARVTGVRGRLQRGFEGMIRWLRPMTATNSRSDQARFTLLGEQHQQPGQGHRATNHGRAVQDGHDRARSWQLRRHDGLFVQIPRLIVQVSEPDPHRVGHSWDAAQPSIEPTSITAGHRPSDWPELWRSVKPSAFTIGPLPVRSAGREGIISPAWLRAEGRAGREDPETAA